MRGPAKPIQGGSTPSGTFIELLLVLPSKDVRCNSNHKFQFHQMLMKMIHMDQGSHYQKDQ